MAQQRKLLPEGDTSVWLAVFDDALLGQGGPRPLRNNAYDFVIDGESCRSRLKPDVEEDGSPPSAPVTGAMLRRRKRSPRLTPLD